MNTAEATGLSFTDALVIALEKQAADRRAAHEAAFRARQAERMGLDAREEELRVTIADRGPSLAPGAVEDLATVLKRKLTLVRLDFRLAMENVAERLNGLSLEVSGEPELEAEFKRVVDEYHQCELEWHRSLRNARARAAREIKAMKQRMAA